MEFPFPSGNSKIPEGIYGSLQESGEFSGNSQNLEGIRFTLKE
jgi:hypothetical protein